MPTMCGGVAQLGEHLLCTQGVSGSIPLISTNRSLSAGMQVPADRTLKTA